MERTLLRARRDEVRRGGRWSDSIADSVVRRLSRLQETVTGREAWPAAVHGATEPDAAQQLDSNN